MTDQNTPLVSVCIPVFNGEQFIRQAIESVLAQTLTDWELVILDNSSSDNTAGIVKTYSDPRVRLIVSDRNYGIEANWNKALSEAKGRYIKVLPSDDYLLPDCLEEQVEVFNHPGNETVVMVSGGRNIVDQSGNYLISRTFPGKDGFIKGRTAIKKLVRAGTNLLGEPAAILFKHEIIEKAGLFDGSQIYVIDVDLWSRILFLGDLYVIHKSVCAFRLSSGSCSVDVASRQSRHFTVYLSKLFHTHRGLVSRFDLYHGILMCIILALGRRFFYLIAVKKVTGEYDQGKNIISQASLLE
jgi:glycosyltransferase involved in cell wall biosynthesis